MNQWLQVKMAQRHNGKLFNSAGLFKGSSFAKICTVKKLTLFILTCLLFTAGYSQQDATAGTIDKIRQIPAFSVVKVPDSIVFTNDQLQKNKPVVLMFFNPDCDHCQKEVKELLAHKNELKELQIVMLSALPYQLIKAFYNEYKIASMPNITMGQDENFVLGSIYQPARYPSLYIYEAAGTLAKVFAGNAGVAALLDAVK